jgi:hypothetical protein
MLSIRGIIASGLVVCYALCCVWALWNRVDAVTAFALTSLATIAFTTPRNLSRVLIGFVVDAIATALLFLPAIGDIVDAVGGLIAVVVYFGKWARFLRNLPCGLAWCGLVAGIWYEGRIFPPSFAATAPPHGYWFLAGVSALRALAGILLVGLLVGLAKLVTRREFTEAMFYSVGYPWYLLMFALAFFMPDPDFRDAST